MSTRSFILRLNQSEESHKSDKLPSMYSQPVGHQGSYNIQYGTKATTMSGRARRLLLCPVELVGIYNIRQGTQATTITGRARRRLQCPIGHIGSYNVRQGMRAPTMSGRARGLLRYPVHGHMYKTFILQSHDHLLYFLINHINLVMPSPRCISHVQQYYDHLIQFLNRSPLTSWSHTQYIYHPSIINHNHLQLISCYHHQ